jgi:16S rRNA (cytosine967-C5)-methyltransferase
MSRFNSYIKTARLIIETYKGEMPLTIYLKHFFASNKKYGSRDRRQITALCFNFYRMGHAAASLPPDEKFLLASFLCEEPSELLQELKPQWGKKITLPLSRKLALLEGSFSADEIFPLTDQLSEGVNGLEYSRSFLVQPDLFIRIRPQTRISVLKKLERSKLAWKLIGEDCAQLTVTDKLEDIFVLNKEVVVQDYNSQKVLEYLKKPGLPKASPAHKTKPGLTAWDCCAASGGKSILLYDILNRRIDLTVSDIRPNIILNLHGRFKKAGIKEYRYFIADISNGDSTLEGMEFDLVICDAPCTGSGTWSRTPEQLTFFRKTAIQEYSTLQKNIIANVFPCLKSGGLLFYITCSVFREENEGICAFIGANFSCKLMQSQLLKGYDKKADTMFVAVFQKL